MTSSDKGGCRSLLDLGVRNWHRRPHVLGPGYRVQLRFFCGCQTWCTQRGGKCQTGSAVKRQRWHLSTSHTCPTHRDEGNHADSILARD
jgi:hypothetical protein